MAFNYNSNYFIASFPNIYGNENLRNPQIEAYDEIKKYFTSNYENRNALVVLPTGVGKTGVIGLAPYGICKKRVLIITPWTTIRDTVLDSLNPDYYDNFWLKRDVFKVKTQLPNVIEYNGKETTYEVLSASNMVILNVQKLQVRLESSLLKLVPNDFFDMIIIDEAHHSTARTWIECVKYFSKAKVLKLTGTPFRTDKREINGELIYKYPLSRAMYNGFIKTLQNIQYIPDELRLTIDGDTSREYTIEEIYDKNLKDSEWITRSVAYSLECSEKVVDESIKLLKDKLIDSNIPHKIIAIACSIEHAKQIAMLYEKKGYKTALIHSKLDEQQKSRIMKSIENHEVKVVINVAMLGEGYDHPYLSIAAIFRPFRNELPYAQFIGRVLRIIAEGSAKDNIAQIVSHKNLELDNLWKKYKVEIQESEIIKRLRDYDDILDEDFDKNHNTGNTEIDTLGEVKEYGNSSLIIENYMDTELLKKSREEEKKTQDKINKIVSLLGISEEQARLMVEQVNSNSSLYKRPDLIYSKKKKNIDSKIREEIVPRLIATYNINEEGSDLKNLSLFTGRYWYIVNKVKKNNAMLAMYMNSYLKDKIGKSRKQWLDDDYNRAFMIIEELEIYIEKNIKDFYNK